MRFETNLYLVGETANKIRDRTRADPVLAGTAHELRDRDPVTPSSFLQTSLRPVRDTQMQPLSHPVLLPYARACGKCTPGRNGRTGPPTQLENHVLSRMAVRKEAPRRAHDRAGWRIRAGLRQSLRPWRAACMRASPARACLTPA